MSARAWPELAMLALGTALLAAGPAAAAPEGEPTAERQRELAHLVRHDCGSCHGLTLKGGLGPPLLPADLEGLPAEGLALIILDGVPGKPMPPWRGLLPEAEVLWIVEQLQEGSLDAP